MKYVSIVLLLTMLGCDDSATLSDTESEISVLTNTQDLQWEKMVPELGDDSPELATLRVDPVTKTPTILARFPTDIHIPRHVHPDGETHVILEGSHLFDQDGLRYDVQKHGHLYMPGGLVHEAWVPAGTLAMISVEGGFNVDWLDGPPSAADVGQQAPVNAH